MTTGSKNFTFPLTGSKTDPILEEFKNNLPAIDTGKGKQVTSVLVDEVTEGELNSVISFYEQKFWETGNLPSEQFTADSLGLTLERVQKARSFDRFTASLTKRGVLIDKEAESVLTPTQILAANMVLNVFDNTSIRQNLELLGVTTAQFSAWQRDPVFQAYLKKRGELLYENSEFLAYKSLIQAVQRGDMKAIQLFFEMKGIYNPKLEITFNVNQVLTKVVEVISRHVDSPEIIEIIAKEIEEVA